jgi:predicted protein tyrosine phosphatase
MTLIVCSLRRLEAHLEGHDPSHLISLLSPAEMIPEHPRLKGRHLRVEVNDVTEPQPGLTAPSEAMVEAILRFGRSWTAERPLLIHCWAGISRSSAAAYILACARNPSTPESRIAQALRAASPAAHPNARFVRLAEARLGRDGRMSAALDALPPPVPVLENEPFTLASRFPPR